MTKYTLVTALQGDLISIPVSSMPVENTWPCAREMIIGTEQRNSRNKWTLLKQTPPLEFNSNAQLRILPIKKHFKYATSQKQQSI